MQTFWLRTFAYGRDIAALLRRVILIRKAPLPTSDATTES